MVVFVHINSAAIMRVWNTYRSLRQVTVTVGRGRSSADKKYANQAHRTKYKTLCCRATSDKLQQIIEALNNLLVSPLSQIYLTHEEPSFKL